MAFGFLTMMFVVFIQTDKISKLTNSIVSYIKPVQSVEKREVPYGYFYVGKEINRYIESLPEDYISEFANFFTRYTRNEQVSSIVLKKSLEKEIPVCLSFALAWGESRFNPRAYNKNRSTNGTIDRGLFQLNNSYRKDWTIEDFYNIEKNAEEGLSYLEDRLREHGGNVVPALASYNAGSRRIKEDGAPYMTLVHVDQILEYEKMLEAEINDFIIELEYRL
jgi:hypothetical protein